MTKKDVNRKIIFYDIIESSHKTEFKFKVEEAIREGWELLGTPSLSLAISDNDRQTKIYIQSIIKRDENDKTN